MAANAIQIIGIGGSVAPASKSRSALEVALSGAEEAGAQTVIFDLHRLQLPIFNPSLLNNPPESAVQLCEAAYRADGLLWSSPMYHGTISGAFKNALDWLYLLGDRNPRPIWRTRWWALSALPAALRGCRQ